MKEEVFLTLPELILTTGFWKTILIPILPLFTYILIIIIFKKIKES